jgi:serine/threonine-protein kinase
MSSTPPAKSQFDSAPPQSLKQVSAVQALAGSEANFSESLGKYRVLGALGQGGMADVFLAVADGPEGFRKLCVVKLLKEELLDDADFRAMFLDEARLAARLNHPNIVQTFEVDESDGRLLLAMEFVEGQPLTRVIRNAEPERFPLSAAVRILCDVLEALDYAHNLADYDGSVLGIVHRDVTPHNVLIGYEGRVKLVDFGIAKSAAAVQATQAGVVKGKVGYMAPEQATGGDVDGRADIFSVGVILWELIAQRRLTAGLTGREIIMRRIRGDEPKIITVVPSADAALAAICDRAMAPDPDARYAHAADMQSALEKWLKGQEEPSRKTWGAGLRDVFASDRRQLRTLIEQRLKDIGVSANIRRSINPMATSSIQMLTPHAASVIARLPSAPPPSVTQTGSESIRGESVSMPPPGGRSWSSLLIGGSMLAAASAALVYVVQMQNAPIPVTAPPAPAVQQAAAPVPAVASVATLPSIDPAPAPPAPAPVAHGGRPPRHGKEPPPALSSKAPDPAPSPPKVVPPKSSARPLDEQDPYR